MIKALQNIKHSLVEKWDAFSDYTERMDKRVFNGVVIGIVLIVFALIMLIMFIKRIQLS
jgi:lipopolysaccharide/colanic/teichoic acid biosynthesis glycosyltransferase